MPYLIKISLERCKNRGCEKCLKNRCESASIREAGNLYLKNPTIDELSLIAGKEEEARNS